MKSLAVALPLAVSVLAGQSFETSPGVLETSPRALENSPRTVETSPLAFDTSSRAIDTSPSADSATRIPLDAATRAHWVINSTFGFFPLTTLTLESGLETWTNTPKEYGTHWSGFGQRVGSKIATSVVSNTMEASLGSIWGEDPRYRRLGEGNTTSHRLKHAMAMVFEADRASGGTMPAYARLIAIPSSRFIANTYLPESQESISSTLGRIGLSFVRRAAGNTLKEFWPDLRRRFSRAHPDTQ